MFTSTDLKQVIAKARPIVERQLDDATQIASFRETVTTKGGDWSQVKALVKAMIQDEREGKGDGKRVRAILEKAENATAYADMLGLGNLNEKNSFADDGFDPETGEIIDTNSAPDVAPQDQVGGPAEEQTHSSDAGSSAPIQPDSEPADQVPGGSPANGGGDHEAVAHSPIDPETAPSVEGVAAVIDDSVRRADASTVALGSDVEAVALISETHLGEPGETPAGGITPAMEEASAPASSVVAFPKLKMNPEFFEPPHPSCKRPKFCGGNSNLGLCGDCKVAAGMIDVTPGGDRIEHHGSVA